MKTLAHLEDLVSIRARIAVLSRTDTALWGIMTVDHMVCHATDAYTIALGGRTLAPTKPPPLPRLVFKWLALRAPMKWPPGVPTVPEINQSIGGTPPTTFAADRDLLLASLEAFVSHTAARPEHPIFGSMSVSDWLRWGFLHMDHHLRQFAR